MHKVREVDSQIPPGYQPPSLYAEKESSPKTCLHNWQVVNLRNVGFPESEATIVCLNCDSWKIRVVEHTSRDDDE